MADRYLHRTPTNPGRFLSQRPGHPGRSLPDTRFSAVLLDATAIRPAAVLEDAHVRANSLTGV